MSLTREQRRQRRQRRIRRMEVAVIGLGFTLLLGGGDVGPSRPAGQIGLESVVTGLQTPTGLETLGDGSGVMFVLQQSGEIVRHDPATGDMAPFLDLSSQVVWGGEQGLLGLALHPDFASNGRLFVNYTDLAGDTVIAEYLAPDRTVADPASERVILAIDQPHELHNGGGMEFGRDGYLYIGVGDGGWPGDVIGTGQDTSTLLGSILRIDVDAEGEDAYGIPPDNPFASGGGQPEIWDYGLRNPWRFAFDPANGDLYIADVGQVAYEEIDRHPAGVPGGLNFGWSVTEGFHCFDAETCDRTGFTEPLLEYGGRRLRTGNCAIIGGPVVRDNPVAALEGRLLFGDFCSGRIWTLQVDPEGAVPVEQLDTDLVITGFATDGADTYVLDYGRGVVYRIVAGSSD